MGKVFKVIIEGEVDIDERDIERALDKAGICGDILLEDEFCTGLIIQNELQKKLVFHAFNVLGGMFEKDCDYVTNTANEMGVTEEELLEAVENLITNN